MSHILILCLNDKKKVRWTDRKAKIPFSEYLLTAKHRCAEMNRIQVDVSALI